MESAGVRLAVLGISIRTPTPKQHKLEKRLDEKEGWRDLQSGLCCFTATVAPWRDEDMAKRARGGGGGRE